MKATKYKLANVVRIVKDKVQVAKLERQGYEEVKEKKKTKPKTKKKATKKKAKGE